MNSRVADPIDEHVGARLRRLRKAKGLSQSDLANALGLTFQQVQKYERGTNRISASMLLHAADSLGVAVGEFFEGAPGRRPGASAVTPILDARLRRLADKVPDIADLADLPRDVQRAIGRVIRAAKEGRAEGAAAETRTFAEGR